jgi:2-oxoglutarate ferredoxin oxidoreductase subunit alpha
MTSNVVVPELDTIEVYDRAIPEDGLESFLPYEADYQVPPMPIAGQGYNVHMTGLTHDERGYPATNPDAQAKMLTRMKDKISSNVNDIVEIEEYKLEDAEIALCAYGSNARSVLRAVKLLRESGIKVGMFRFKTIWPFPIDQIKQLSNKVKKIIVAEVNLGQLVHPIREYADCEVISLPHPGGRLHTPEQIIAKVKEVMN